MSRPSLSKTRGDTNAAKSRDNISMTVTVEIPDRLADAIVPSGGDVSRAVLEAMALEGYRSDRLSEYEVQQLLGFDSRMEVHGFLKEHGVYLRYSIQDFEQ